MNASSSTRNGTARPYPREACVHTLFESQAAAHPDALALAGDEPLTYRELDRRADALAAHLTGLGLRPGALVAVLLARSTSAVVALLATLKAGAAYLPLDPDHPPERLAGLVATAQPDLVVTERRWRAVLGRAVPATVLLEEVPRNCAAPAERPGSRRFDATSPAYVMFTSGSTGEPKAVEVTHRAIVRLVRGTDYVRFGEGEVFLHAAPLTFDASTFEIWGALLGGSRLVVAPAGPLSLVELGDLLASQHVTTAWLPAALFALVAHQRVGILAPLRQLVTGGDVVPVAAARRVLQAFPGIRLVNGYGPTECTTFACCHRVQPGDLDGTAVPIGRPIANTLAYLLDEDLRAVPAGVAGEIFLGGDGLATGYLGREDLTRERFLWCDVGDGSTQRLYRTGDMAYRRPDGCLVFLGRRDRQVKVRGHRVEPAEVEAAAEAHPGVFQAVAVALGESAPERRLVCYFVPGPVHPPSANELRTFLARRLPPYLVPSLLVELAALPRTANGKVDMAALPDPQAGAAPGLATAPAPPAPMTPAGSVGDALAGWWSELLGTDVTGPDCHFFDEGGDSLRAVLLCARIEDELGVTLPVSTVYDHPTHAGLARVLQGLEPPPVWSPLVPVKEAGDRSPLYCVHGLSGDVAALWPLSRALHAEQPLFALRGLGLTSPGELSVPSMAASYVREVQRSAPSGPLRIAGYSAGGVVAFEMVRQLRQSGCDADLILINTESPALLRAEAAQPASSLEPLAEAVGEAPAPTSSYLERRMRFMVGFYRALLVHEPAPLDGDVVLLRANEQPPRACDDTTLGWQDSVRGRVDARPVPGSTLSMLKEPHLDVLAGTLQDVLDALGRHQA